ncbi:hypothetical protein T492DRAFT_184170 [Pavlovales sp. CCMP2436]|nr:hypothetical protein T492DRAFT_184170 [Pavlovales sp. CCMP2436]
MVALVGASDAPPVSTGAQCAALAAWPLVWSALCSCARAPLPARLAMLSPASAAVAIAKSAARAHLLWCAIRPLLLSQANNSATAAPRASKATWRARGASPASTRPAHNTPAPAPGAARLGSQSPRRRRPGSQNLKNSTIFVCIYLSIYTSTYFLFLVGAC